MATRLVFLALCWFHLHGADETGFAATSSNINAVTALEINVDDDEWVTG